MTTKPKPEGFRPALALLAMFVTANVAAIRAVVTAVETAPRSSTVEVQFSRSVRTAERRELAVRLYKTAAVARVAHDGDDRWTITPRDPGNFAEAEWVRRTALDANGVIQATSLAGYILGH